MANWHHDYYFEAVVTHVHELTDAMKAAPVCNVFPCCCRLSSLTILGET